MAVNRVKDQGKKFNFIYPFSGRMWRRVARWLVSDVSRQRDALTRKGRNIQWRSFSRGYFDTWRPPCCPETSDTAKRRTQYIKRTKKSAAPLWEPKTHIGL